MNRATRRRVLRAGGFALLASLGGCLSDSPEAGTTTSPTTETTTFGTADDTVTTTEGREPKTTHYRQLTFYATEMTPEAVVDSVARPLSAFEAERRSLFEATIRDGPQKSIQEGGRNREETVFVTSDGAYYRIENSLVEDHEERAHRFSLDALSKCDDVTPEVREEAVPFDDLPPADQEAFLGDREDHYRQSTCFGGSFLHVYDSDAAVESSVLVSGDPTYVRYENEYYVVEFVRTQRLSVLTYRWEATRIADDRAGAVEPVLDVVVLDLSDADLSDDEREILDVLVDDGTWVRENPIPDAADDLLQRLYEHGAWFETDAGFYGYYVRYDRSLYRVVVEEVQS